MDKISENLKSKVKIWLGSIIRPTYFNKMRVPVFMFHKVVENDEATYCNKINITTADFDNIINVLKQYYRIVCLKELLDGKVSIDNSCVITFDDGWLNTYKNAFPVLVKNNVSATIFLSTGLIGKSECLWFDKLTYIIDNIGSDYDKKAIEQILCRYGITSDLKQNNKSIFYKQIVSKLKKVHPNVINEVINALSLSICKNENIEDKRKILNWNEIHAMSDAGITFGSHCVNHSILPNLSLAEKTYEMVESKHELLKNNTNYVNCISFPNGNYDQETLDVVDQAGYDIAFTASFNKNGTGKSRKLAKRINITTEETRKLEMLFYKLFVAKLKGGYNRVKFGPLDDIN